MTSSDVPSYACDPTGKDACFTGLFTKKMEAVGRGKTAVKIFLLDCPYELCQARFAARTEHPNLLDATLDDLPKHKHKWDYLQENDFPQAIRIDATQPAEAVFTEIFGHLGSVQK